MMVKKTWRNRLTAFMSTAKRYNHASPDILAVLGSRAGRAGARLSVQRRKHGMQSDGGFWVESVATQDVVRDDGVGQHLQDRA